MSKDSKNYLAHLKDLQPWNVEVLYSTFFLELSTNTLRFLQSEKAPLPKKVTFSGIIMFVNPVQPEKAPFPMTVTLLGIITYVNPVQPEKARSPIEVMCDGIS